MVGKRFFHPRALVSAVALAGLLGGSGVRPVAAAEGPTTLREQRQGIVAQASAEQCTPVGPTQRRCRSLTLQVFDGSERSSGQAPFRGTRVCLSLVTRVVGTGTPPTAGPAAGSQEEQGCATLTVGTLHVAPQLARVQLPATALTLEQVRCTPVGRDEAVCEVIGHRQATISGSWTATSRLVSSHSSTHAQHGTCVETRAEHERRRETRAQLTLDRQAQAAQSSSVARVLSLLLQQCR